MKIKYSFLLGFFLFYSTQLSAQKVREVAQIQYLSNAKNYFFLPGSEWLMVNNENQNTLFNVVTGQAYTFKSGVAKDMYFDTKNEWIIGASSSKVFITSVTTSQVVKNWGMKKGFNVMYNEKEKKLYVAEKKIDAYNIGETIKQVSVPDAIQRINDTIVTQLNEQILSITPSGNGYRSISLRSSVSSNIRIRFAFWSGNGKLIGHELYSPWSEQSNSFSAEDFICSSGGRIEILKRSYIYNSNGKPWTDSKIPENFRSNDFLIYQTTPFFKQIETVSGGDSLIGVSYNYLKKQIFNFYSSGICTIKDQPTGRIIANRNLGIAYLAKNGRCHTIHDSLVCIYNERGFQTYKLNDILNSSERPDVIEGEIISSDTASVSVILQSSHTSQILSAVCSKSGNHLLTFSTDNILKIWDNRFDRILHSFKIENKRITNAAFINNDNNIIICSVDGFVYNYSLSSKQILKYKCPTSGKILSIKQTGESIYLTSRNQVIQVEMFGQSAKFKELASLTQNDYYVDVESMGIDKLRVICQSSEKLIQPTSGKIISETKYLNSPVVPDQNHAAFYQDSLLFIGGVGEVRVYKNGKQCDRIFFKMIKHEATSIASAGQGQVIWVNDGGEIFLYNTRTLKILLKKHFKGHKFSSVVCNPTHSQAWIGEKNGVLSIFNFISKELKSPEIITNAISCVDYDKVSNRIFWSDNHGKMNMLNMNNSFELKSNQLNQFEITAFKYVPFENVIYAGGFTNRLYRVSVNDSITVEQTKIIKMRPAIRNIGYAVSTLAGKPKMHRFQVNDIMSFKNDSVISCLTWNNNPLLFKKHIKIFPKGTVHYSTADFNRTSAPVKHPFRLTGSSEIKVTGFVTNDEENNYTYRYNNVNPRSSYFNQISAAHLGLISSEKITSDSLLMITGGRDGSIQLWNKKAKEKPQRLCYIYQGKDGDKLIINNQNYYWGSRSALDRIGFNFNGKFFFPDQLDFVYNRPDLVLKSIDSVKYASQIKTFYKAYQKRLKKAGLSEKLIIANLDKLPELEVKKISEANGVCTFLISDKKYTGKNVSIHVWNNGVPVFGTQGIPPLKKDESRTILVPLVSGNNKIQFSALDNSGTEGFRSTFMIENKTETIPELYYVGIGCSEFKESDYNLKYAEKDVKDVLELLKASKNFKQVHSLMLLGKDFTLENVKQIREFLSQSKPNDHVIMFYAGHGLLDKDLNYYFVPVLTNFHSPETTAIPYELVESQLDSIPAYKKLFLIDACHSGDLDKEEIVASNTFQTAGDGVKFRSIGKNKLAYNSSSTFDLMRELFIDLKRGTGATVISSAGGIEFAMEGKDWSNGLFTYCLLNGMKSKKADLDQDGKVMISEMQKYLLVNVKKISHGLQAPDTREQNNDMDYVLW